MKADQIHHGQECREGELLMEEAKETVEEFGSSSHPGGSVGTNLPAVLEMQEMRV